MTRFGLFASALAIGGLIAVTPFALAQSVAPAAPGAQQPDHQEHHPAAEQAPDVKAQETQMMAMQQKMMADMKAADATLDALVTRMNTVKGNAKVDVIAELLTTMVQQQRTMHNGMMQMHGQMMIQMHGQMTEPKGGVK
jgi:hypothetical protein